MCLSCVMCLSARSRGVMLADCKTLGSRRISKSNFAWASWPPRAFGVPPDKTVRPPRDNETPRRRADAAPPPIPALADSFDVRCRCLARSALAHRLPSSPAIRPKYAILPVREHTRVETVSRPRLSHASALRAASVITRQQLDRVISQRWAASALKRSYVALITSNKATLSISRDRHAELEATP